MDVTTVFRCDPRQVEEIDGRIFCVKYLPRDLCQSETLGHFARAGVLRA